MLFKKFFPFFLFLTLFISQTSSGQVAVGFSAGPSFSTLSWELETEPPFEIDPWDTKTGFTAGAFIAVPLAKTLAVRGELNFERKGGKMTGVTFTDENGNALWEGDAKNHLDYLVLPVLMDFSFGNKSKVFFQAGPTVAYLLHHQFKPVFPDIMKPFTMEDFNRVDLLATIGAGFRWPLNEKIALEINARTSFGFNDLMKSDLVESRSFSAAGALGVQYYLN